MTGSRAWFLLFLFVGTASGALVILWLMPMMELMSDLGRTGAFLLGTAISAAFTVAVMGMFERLRGDRQDPE